MSPIRYRESIAAERGMDAARHGEPWSAIRADLEREAEYLRMADTAERNGCPVTARKFRADAAAAVSRHRIARLSTFPGEQPPHIPGQTSIF